MTTSETPIPASKGYPAAVTVIASFVISAALPLLLILINARVLMTNLYLNWEYNRPNFPVDTYGMTTEERLNYAPKALGYLFNSAGIDYLGNETFPDGTPLYNERELSHMQDVKGVTALLTHIGLGLLALEIVGIGVLAAKKGARPALWRALFSGSVLTVALIILGLIGVATSFEWLFTQFHRIFFTGNSWIFLFSDTLIRLFPEKFWIDAFALMFGGAMLEAIILGVVMWRLMRREQPIS